MNENSYNGWSNYPTWCVNLWLSNDEGLYQAATEMAERARSDAQWHRGHPRIDLADALRSWVRDDLAPDLGASFAADLLGHALDQVNWHEVAKAWLDEVAAEGDDAA